MIGTTARVRRTGAALAVGLLAACSENSLEPGNDTRVVVTYTGERSGTLDASGRPASATANAIARGDYAVAVGYDATNRAGTFSIIANDAAGSPYGDMLLLGEIPAHTGTYTLSNILGGALLFGVTWNDSMFGENDYNSIDNGQLTVTSFSSTRVRGSFQATATHYVFNPNPTPVGTIQVNGNFNVVFDNLVAVTFRCRLFEC